jgi:hypothetical protein
MRHVIALIPLLWLPGCASPGSGPADSPPPAGAAQDPTPREKPMSGRLEQLRLVEEPSPPPAVSGEVPDEILERIRRDATSRLGVEAASLEQVRAEAVTWNDGALGCPQPDVVYTQALEPGYWVVLQANGRQLDYRARASGYFFICESSAGNRPPRQEGQR